MAVVATFAGTAAHGTGAEKTESAKVARIDRRGLPALSSGTSSVSQMSLRYRERGGTIRYVGELHVGPLTLNDLLAKEKVARSNRVARSLTPNLAPLRGLYGFGMVPSAKSHTHRF